MGSPFVFVTIPFKTTCTSEVTESLVSVFSEFLSEQEKKKKIKREKKKPFTYLIFIILKVINYKRDTPKLNPFVIVCFSNRCETIPHPAIVKIKNYS
jgi:hypothetical protein